MTPRDLRLIATGTLVLTMAACATVEQNRRTALGAGAGAVAGAALGTLVGGDDRRNALVGAGIGLVAGSAVGQYLDQQQRALESSLAGTGAEIERQGDTLNVSLPSGITFDIDSATIRPEFRQTLDAVAGDFNQFPQSTIDVIGHTDSTGSDAYNQALSERRAASVANYLRGRGVLPARLAAFGVGETQPVASNDTEFGRAENRRVEIRIVPVT